VKLPGIVEVRAVQRRRQAYEPVPVVVHAQRVQRRDRDVEPEAELEPADEQRVPMYSCITTRDVTKAAGTPLAMQIPAPHDPRAGFDPQGRPARGQPEGRQLLRNQKRA